MGRKKQTTNEADPKSQEPDKRPLPDTWNAPLGRFVTENAEWCEAIRTVQTSTEPLYWIPGELINSLSKIVSNASGSKRAILSAQEVRAENAFRYVCQGYLKSTIGIQEGLPIIYILGNANSAKLDLENPAMQEFLDQFSSSDRNKYRNSILTLNIESDSIEMKSLGRAGQITFDADYRSERDRLRKLWEKLEKKVPFPWTKSLNVHGPIEESQGDFVLSRLTDTEVDFVKSRDAFFRKWEICRMVNWDLPIILGPSGPISLAEAALRNDPETLVNITPSYLTERSDYDRKIRDEETQQMNAENLGRLGSYPVQGISGRDGTSSFAQAFQMYIYERAITKRYPNRPGIIGRIEDGFADLFDIGSDRVKQLRKHYSGLAD